MILDLLYIYATESFLRNLYFSEIPRSQPKNDVDVFFSLFQKLTYKFKVYIFSICIYLSCSLKSKIGKLYKEKLTKYNQKEFPHNLIILYYELNILIWLIF